MRDYTFEDDAGREVPVSEMSTADIHECLGPRGFRVTGGEDPGAIRERLRIELVARKLEVTG